MNYDVAVVGGGPSGVICALSVARAGFKVAILDKKPHELIGNKNCGDALDYKHVNILKDKLDIDPPNLENGEARDLIEKVTIAANGIENKLSAYSNPGYIVNRHKYGQRLLKLAINAGVTIIDNANVRDVIIENKTVSGVIYYDHEGEHKLRAKITVDASGFIATIRKKIPDDMRGGFDYSLPDKYIIRSYREIIELPNPHNFRKEIILIYDKHIPAPGYIWIFSEGERLLNIGITWRKDDPYPQNKSLKDLYHELLDPYFPDGYKVLYHGGGNIPMRPNFDSLVFNGAVLVGDAAAVVDPTTFEGHGPALESGRLAAIAIIEALQKNDYSRESLWKYNKLVMNYPGGMHAQSYMASNFLREMGVNNLEFLLARKIITEKELIDIFQDPEASLKFSSKLKMMFRSFPRWDLLFKMYKLTKKIEHIGEIYANYPDNADDISAWINKRDSVLML